MSVLKKSAVRNPGCFFQRFFGKRGKWTFRFLEFFENFAWVFQEILEFFEKNASFSRKMWVFLRKCLFFPPFLGQTFRFLEFFENFAWVFHEILEFFEKKSSFSRKMWVFLRKCLFFLPFWVKLFDFLSFLLEFLRKIPWVWVFFPLSFFQNVEKKALRYSPVIVL